jgi:hypothetical protein
MSFRTISFLLVLSSVGNTAGTSEPGIDLGRARDYFLEAQLLCEKDGGELWGQSLCVPIAFIHPQTREVVTNLPDSAATPLSQDGVFLGTWPDTLAIANSSAVWRGTRWTTLMWPLPEEKKLGFPAMTPSNAHLDSREGRIWLRLEWRALRLALTSTGLEQQRAVRDALVFRTYRRQLFSGSADSESRMEMHEGLAEYTGIRLCGLSADSARKYLAGDLYETCANAVSFISTFAYWSGPAYGLLLDEYGGTWRKGLTPDMDLGKLLQTALRFEPPNDLGAAAEEVCARYGGATVRTEELAREQEHNRKLADFRARLVDGPVLILPLAQMNIQYDPRGMVSMDSLGTVYPTIRISDIWGIVDVSGGGALMSTSWTSLRVPAPTDTIAQQLKGDGWTLQLSKEWYVIPAERPGDFTLKSRR